MDMSEIYEKAKTEVKKRTDPESVLGAYFTPLVILKWRFFVTLSTTTSEKFTLQDKIDAACHFLWSWPYCLDYIVAGALASIYLYFWPNWKTNIDILLLKRKRSNETKWTEAYKAGLIESEVVFQIISSIEKTRTNLLSPDEFALFSTFVQERIPQQHPLHDEMSRLLNVSNAINRLRDFSNLARIEKYQDYHNPTAVQQVFKAYYDSMKKTPD